MKVLSFILLPSLAIYCLLFSLVDGSGLYMQAARRREFTNKIRNREKVLLDILNEIQGTEVDIPTFTEDPKLAEIDEKYSRCNGIDIREITIHQVLEYFAKNKLTSLQLAECYIKRIKEMNDVMHVVNEINPDALAEASKADFQREYMNPADLGLLHGIPILLKENIGTLDKMETTAGALALLGTKPNSDADVVKALRKAGVVILGKSNLSEFAAFRGTNIPSGWSGRGNQTRNAYNLNVNPSGSSSGSAVSVSANLIVASLGTETDGSLICPSNVAGIFTIKPSHGTPSIKGIIPISNNQDHVGPMARTVMDLSILLDAMIPDNERHSSQPKSFTESLKNEKNRPFRIGIMRNPYFNTTFFNSPNLEAELPQINQFIKSLQDSSEFKIFDPLSPSLSLIKNITGIRELVTLTHDFKNDFNEYLRNMILHYPLPKISSLKDVIKFNDEHPTVQGYNQLLLEWSDLTDGVQNETYISYRDMNKEAAAFLLDSVLKTHNLDAVLTPSECLFAGVSEAEYSDNSFMGYSMAAISGYPSMHIPIGIDPQGVPFGITLMGLPYTEAVLLQIGYKMEKMNPQRPRPKFLI